MKTFLIDTNVFLHNPTCLKSFRNSEIIISLTVLDELDKAKRRPDEVGRNARAAIRFLDDLRMFGNLHEGVKYEDAIIKVEPNHINNLPKSLSLDSNDNRILSTAIGLSKEGKHIVVISKDINMRVKCDALGITAEDYETDKITEGPQYIYSGMKEIHCSSETIDNLYKTSDGIAWEGLPNQAFILKSENPQHVGLGKVVDGKLKKIENVGNLLGIIPRNVEQKIALDLLLDPKIKLVSLVGKAGGGKTLLAVSAGLHHILNFGNTFSKLLISRPIQPMGKDLGYLPGPQPLDAKVLTSTGWKFMGELEVGQQVIARDGKPSKIIGIYPKGVKNVYKITTTDNRETECCLDHLWYTETKENRKRAKKGKIKNTKEILETLKDKNGKLNHRLPENELVYFNNQKLSIPPYVMGVILGKGSSGDYVNISNTDPELIERVNRDLKKIGCTLTNIKNSISYNIRRINAPYNKTARRIEIKNIETGKATIFNRIGEALESQECSGIQRGRLHYLCTRENIVDNKKFRFLPAINRWTNPVKNILFNMDLLGLNAPDKFIPDQYIYGASVQNRIDLLRGLMDSEGTIKEKTGEASFCTTSIRLAENIVALVRSLGGRATIRSRDRRGKKGDMVNGREIVSKHICYEFTISFKDINPFYISRKASRYRPRKFFHGSWIKSVEYVGKKCVQCIKIDNPEHLYITDDFIVTHNTIEEKLDPWMQPIYDNLEFLLGNNKENVRMYRDQGIIQVEALTYIRGRSIPRSFMIVDEAQNLSKDEVKTIITRVGEDTKIVFTGDIAQIDKPYLDFADNGLTYIVEKFKEYSIAGHITLNKGERSELATLAAEIL